ncbi:MAG: hypothetical protein JG782_634 [Anaerophaga sp.]|nr:hypothetical protein [Anaerophaga sp.]MDI3520508.1 hypothetical protein [Anaerophaga sp.]MDK2840909.1 hypothetical protein [Anaerophaga sp.]MDN5289771.1 hypothetical protein [Anaerophaga sp.]
MDYCLENVYLYAPQNEGKTLFKQKENEFSRLIFSFLKIL